MYDICSAVLEINPSAQISVSAEGTENEEITWHNGTAKISKSKIQAKQAELKTAYDAKEYQRKRAEEYPSINELVVALYDTADKADIDKRRAEIKKKYPK
jgi:hypothetical protein